MRDNFSFRWGVPILDAGHIPVYRWMLQNYSKAGVTRDEFLFIIHIADFHYETSDGQAHPSLEMIKDFMGYKHVNSVYRLRDSLIEKNMLIRIPREGLTDIYNVHPFAQKMQELWEEAEQAGQATPAPLHPSVGVGQQPLHPSVGVPLHPSVGVGQQPLHPSVGEEEKEEKEKKEMEDILLLWKTASEELQRQLPRETYDTLLRPATLLAAGDDTLTVAAHSEGARDWLQSRLDPVIRRTLRSVAGREIEVIYEVMGGSHV